MSYKCEIIADSLSPQGNRLTTYVVTYPRIVHAEMCRHRMLSRNTASSRAIPLAKMIKDVQENPFIPIAWQKDHKGMQGTEYFKHPEIIEQLEEVWLDARNEAVDMAKFFSSFYGLGLENKEGFIISESIDSGVTKQLCNRLLEPFVWTTEIITGTEWGNFFELRCPQYVVNWYSSQKNKTEIFRSRKEVINHVEENNLKNGWENCRNWGDNQWLQINNSQAEIHIQAIAELMWDAMNESTPKQLQAGEWHIPFGDNIDLEEWYNSNKRPSAPYYSELEPDEIDKYLVKIAVAREARISYTTLGDNPKIDYEADIKLHDRLMEMKHWSPFEHCAKTMSDEEFYQSYRGNDLYSMEQYNSNNKIESYLIECSRDINDPNFGWCRNFRGFIQYRHMVES